MQMFCFIHTTSLHLSGLQPSQVLTSFYSNNDWKVVLLVGRNVPATVGANGVEGTTLILLVTFDRQE